MLYFISCIFVALLLSIAISGFSCVLEYPAAHIAEYQWAFYGFAIYFVIYFSQLFSSNRKWRHTVAHEFAHALVALMFGGKIFSFHAGQGDGLIKHSKPRFGAIFVTLAPYCLTYLTYLVLLLRIIGDEKFLFIFDILAGMTLGFHICCFCTQARPYQSDIKSAGYIRSYMFIATAILFNLSIIILTIPGNIFRAFATLFQCYWDNITILIESL